MNSPRLVRGSKSRLFLYLGALSLVGLTVYLYHGAQMQLDDAKRAAGKCSQQQESLSAQLQVIFEYKLRLEKSLQQEKNEHRQTRDELQAKAAAEKLRVDKDMQETMNKYTSLQQQHKLLKSQHGDLDEECRRARDAQATLEQAQAARGAQLEELKTSFMQLEIALETERKLHAEAAAKEAPLANAGRHLEKKNKQLERELVLAEEKLKACSIHQEVVKPAPGGGLEKPILVASKTTESGRLPMSPDVEDPDKLAAHLKSTTPQINPDALSPEERGAALPVPPPQKQAARLPDGVVPAPEGFAEETRKEVREVNQVDSPWGWHKVQPAHHFEDNQIPEKQFQHNLLPVKQFEQNPLPMDQYQNQPMNQFNNNHFPVNQIDRNHFGVNQFDRNQVPVNQIDRNHFPVNQFVRNQIPVNQFHRNDLPGNHFGHNQKPANHFGQQQLFNQVDNQQPIHLQRNQHGVDQAGQHDNLVHLQRLNAANQRPDVARPANHNAAFLANDLAHGRPANQNGAYPYNGDYEKDGQRNDLQLEENEEEEDDDVDQIDYGNDNNKKKEEKRDGVMVNPK